MNAYEKWGIRYLNRLMWHLTTVSTLWGLYEVKYHEIVWQDLGWAVLVGAVMPTLKEAFTEGLPIPQDTKTDESKPVSTPSNPGSPT